MSVSSLSNLSSYSLLSPVTASRTSHLASMDRDNERGMDDEQVTTKAKVAESGLDQGPTISAASSGQTSNASNNDLDHLDHHGQDEGGNDNDNSGAPKDMAAAEGTSDAAGNTDSDWGSRSATTDTNANTNANTGTSSSNRHLQATLKLLLESVEEQGRLRTLLEYVSDPHSVGLQLQALVRDVIAKSTLDVANSGGSGGSGRSTKDQSTGPQLVARILKFKAFETELTRAVMQVYIHVYIHECVHACQVCMFTYWFWNLANR
jgi:hypothetical protein